MENQMLAVEQSMKIEVGAVKVETVEIDSGLLEVEQIIKSPAIKDDNDEKTEGIVINRIKNEQNCVEAEMKFHESYDKFRKLDGEKIKMEGGKIKLKSGEIKLETDVDYGNFEDTGITEEFIIKTENDCHSFMDANTEINMNRLSSEFAEVEEEDAGKCTPTAVTSKTKELVQSEKMNPEMFMDMRNCRDVDNAQFHHTYSSTQAQQEFSKSAVKWKIPERQRHIVCRENSKMSYSCYNCSYSSYRKYRLINHMQKHKNRWRTHPRCICIHCNATFDCKKNLDNHIVRKHPDFIATVSSKVHECTHCTFKTTLKYNLSRHMLNHHEKAHVPCDATFKRDKALEDRTIRKHSDSIGCVTHNTHKLRNNETIIESVLTKHMLNHPETADSYKLMMCIHCNATFKRKRNLDEHTIRKHPDFIASVSSKILECAHCTYKTAIKLNLDEHTIREHPDFIASVSSKIHECTHCTYKTTNRRNLTSHMSTHPAVAESYKLSIACTLCKATFTSKTSLDDHTIKKHPDFIASVSSKIRQCTHCTYKTTMKSHLTKHLLKHPDTADCYEIRSYKLRTCIHCNVTYKSKQMLDEHTIRKHPHFISSVTNRIHECAHCTYKTVIKSNLDRHIMSQHPGTAGTYKHITCIRCNKSFKRKITLDEHTIRNHPDFITTVSSKIHRCTQCTYKTTLKPNLAIHLLEHPETPNIYKLGICIHCNATFKSRKSLDDHTVRKHPDSIASVTNKIHECAHCTYKTVMKSNFDRHVSQHPETAGTYKLWTCRHCDKSFKNKTTLDEHIIRNHPDFIASVSSKTYTCRYCTYKTTAKSSFDSHLLKHPETADKYKLSKCIHCNMTYKSKRFLDEHTIRIHPDFIASVSTKIHKCADCTYKTVMKPNFDRHVFEHLGKADTTFESKTFLDEHTIRNHPDFITSVTSKTHACSHCTYKTTSKDNLSRHMLKHPEAAVS